MVKRDGQGTAATPVGVPRLSAGILITFRLCLSFERKLMVVGLAASGHKGT